MSTRFIRYFFTIFCLALGLLPSQASALDFRFYVGELFPFVYKTQDGKWNGAVVEEVTAMMKEAGLPVSPSSFNSISWPRAIEDVKTTPGMAIFCMGRTEQRESNFKWVGPIAHLRLGLIASRAKKISISSPEDLRQYRIGVIRSSAPHQMLVNNWGVDEQSLTLLTTNEQQLRMLAKGRVDLVAQATVSSPYYIRKLHMKPDDFELVHVLQDLPLYVAFNVETPDSLIHSLQKALGKIQDSTSGMSRFEASLIRHTGGKPLGLSE